MTTQFIKLPAVKRLAMDLARRRFGDKKFTRFAGPDWAAELDDLVRNHVTKTIANMPSTGKTVYPGHRLSKEEKKS